MESTSSFFHELHFLAKLRNEEIKAKQDVVKQQENALSN